MPAEGVRGALQWGGWSWLEPALSGMGQPRPLLTGAAPQPPAGSTSSQTPGADTVSNTWLVVFWE